MPFGLIGTVADPDGNYVQIIQWGAEPDDARGAGHHDGRMTGAKSASCVDVIGGAMLVATCGGDESTASVRDGRAAAARPDRGAGAGDANTGYLAPNQPDVNGDGKVVIGILSPGDTHDHGYYESFVDEANAFAKENGWTVVDRRQGAGPAGARRRPATCAARSPTWSRSPRAS